MPQVKTFLRLTETKTENIEISQIKKNDGVLELQFSAK